MRAILNISQPFANEAIVVTYYITAQTKSFITDDKHICFHIILVPLLQGCSQSKMTNEATDASAESPTHRHFYEKSPQ